MRLLQALGLGAALALAVLASRAHAPGALPKWGGGDVSAWSAGLASRDPAIRRQAAEALSKFGRDAEAAVGPLVHALGDPDAAVRDHAAAALHRIGPAAVRPLTLALADSEPRVRRVAAAALARLEPVPPAAVGALAARLHDADAQVRRNAVEALARAGAPAVPALRDALRDARVEVRRE